MHSCAFFISLFDLFYMCISVFALFFIVVSLFIRIFELLFVFIAFIFFFFHFSHFRVIFSYLFFVRVPASTGTWKPSNFWPGKPRPAGKREGWAPASGSGWGASCCTSLRKPDVSTVCIVCGVGVVRLCQWLFQGWEKDENLGGGGARSRGGVLSHPPTHLCFVFELLLALNTPLRPGCLVH